MLEIWCVSRLIISPMAEFLSEFTGTDGIPNGLEYRVDEQYSQLTMKTAFALTHRIKLFIPSIITKARYV